MSGAEKDVSRAFGGTHTIAAGGGAADQARLPAALDGEDDRRDRMLPIGGSALATRVRGRPKNAKNRRTDLVAEYLIGRYGDPLEADMATGMMPLGELIVELRKIASDVGMKLGGSVMDIARFQRDCRNDAKPYLHAKRAPETAKGDPVLPVFAVGRFEQTVVVAGPGRSLDDVIDQQHQQVIEHNTEVSHEGKSHDDE